MAVGRITGPLLKANLLRQGVDLAFETDLLYLQVTDGNSANHRVGIKTDAPSHTLTVNGTSRTTSLIVDTLAEIANISISGTDISTTQDVLTLTPGGISPVVYQAKLRVDDIDIENNVISTTSSGTNLELRPNGAGTVEVFSDVNVTGNIHATGNITADGDIQLGNSSTDTVTFAADLASNLIPDADNTYTLGKGGNTYSDSAFWDSPGDTVYNGTTLAITVTPSSSAEFEAEINDAQIGDTITIVDSVFGTSVLTLASTFVAGTPVLGYTIYTSTVNESTVNNNENFTSIAFIGKRWADVWATTIYADNVITGDLVVDNINLNLPQGKIIYVASAGNDSYSGVHQNDPYATISFALSQAVAGDTVYIYPGTYTEVFPLTIPAGVSVKGSGIRSVKIIPTVGTNSNNAVLMNGETTVEDLTIADFFSPGVAFSFASNITVTSRSPYVRNVSVITKGSVTSPSDPLGFDQGDAGKGVFLDGSVVNASSNEAAMLFHSVTFITPGVDCIVATNGVRIEWLNSFTYYANKSINAYSSADGFASAGLTQLRINSQTGTWAVGNTLSYYDTDGVTLLASGTIASVDGDYVKLTGRQLGFETITDRAPKTVYVNGDAKISTAQQKFGPSSLLLDGTGDYLSYTTQPDFAFGTGDFTIETWAYRNVTTGAQTIFDFRSATVSDAPLLYFNGGSLVYYTSGVAQITGAAVVPDTGVWYHIAVSRSGTDTKMFVNGSQVGSTWTDATDYSQDGLTIGASYTGTVGFVNGYLDDVRISKGIARYTTTFTAPTAALSGDLNTVLLLHFNGNNDSTIILDDGVTLQDLRTSAGGTASLINFADYSDFGAEIRSIGSAAVYGNYGIYGDGPGVIAYLISENLAYIGAGKLTTNDPTDRIAANEVVELNSAKIYYTSVDNEGNFKVGDSFFVNQKTGEVEFNGQALSVTTVSGVVFDDGVNVTTVLPGEVTTGNIYIHDNTIESLTGDINVTAANGAINLQNNTYITGDLDVTGNVTIGGNITIGNETTDTISFVGGITSDLIPATTALYNLGTDPLRWDTAYLNRAEIDGLVIDNNTISTTIGNDNLILTANGSGVISIPSNNVVVDNNLTITQDLTVTTGTTYLKAVDVTGTITQTGNINQTGNFTTSGTADITGNITATGYLQLSEILVSTNIISTRNTDVDLELQPNGAGSVIFEGYKITNNNIQTTSTNADIVLTPQGTGNVVVNSDQSIVIPVGTTLERPSVPANGMIRYNTDTEKYEGYSNSNWTRLGGVESVDGRTRILPEATPGAGDNILYFYADNNLTATIDSQKLYTVDFQTSQLDITSNTISALGTDTDINFVTTGTGAVVLGNLRFSGNSIVNTVSNAVTEFAEAGTGYVKIGGTYGVVIPSGDNASRPGLSFTELGMIRFNTENQFMEVFNGVVWTSVAGTSSGVNFNDATDIGIAMSLTVG